MSLIEAFLGYRYRLELFLKYFVVTDAATDTD